MRLVVHDLPSGGDQRAEFKFLGPKHKFKFKIVNTANRCISKMMDSEDNESNFNVDRSEDQGADDAFDPNFSSGDQRGTGGSFAAFVPFSAVCQLFERCTSNTKSLGRSTLR